VTWPVRQEPSITLPLRARLHALATASPPHVLEQGAVAEAARAVFAGRFREFDRLAPVFAHAGIARRQSVMPMSWHMTPHDWPERTAAYLKGADDLFVAAAQGALERAGLAPGDVDAIVTVSSTGIATPSLEARAMGRLDFRPDVSRLPVFGLGCAGGVTGLAAAARLAQARPGSLVLFVCVELCTLSVRLDQLTSANLVATALFGDGAAACVLSTRGGGLCEVEGAAEHTWPDTLGIMGWSVDSEGFGVIFDRSIPAFATANLGQAMTTMLASIGLARDDVERFVFHPGGAKVIEAVERALDLSEGALNLERGVLKDHGNMSAPTALFVLERVLAAKPPARMVVAALGPGFTASCLSLTS
jgi:alkylresorcinol/alkylpyrone synthase